MYGDFGVWGLDLKSSTIIGTEKYIPYFTEYSPTAFEVENFTSLGGGIVIRFQSENRKVHGKA